MGADLLAMARRRRALRALRRVHAAVAADLARQSSRHTRPPTLPGARATRPPEEPGRVA